MSFLRFRLPKIIRLLFRSVFRRNIVEAELDEELRYHVERQTEVNVAAGMTRRDALNAALKEFSGLEHWKEECRDMRRLNLIDNMVQDVRFSTRQLSKTPAFTVTAVLVLALGLSAAVAIFAFVDAALLKPLPYRDSSRLVGVYESIPKCPQCDLSYLDYKDWKRLNKVFTDLEIYRGTGVILTTPGGSEPEPAHAALVSDGFFRLLGVSPVIGRDFYASEDQPGAAHSVLLSNASWQKRYGGKADAVGQTVTLDGEQYSIIGVLPPSFHFAPVGQAEFWTTVDSKGWCELHRGCHSLYGVARLRDGVSVRAALADTTLIAQQLEKQYPDSNRGQGASVLALSDVIVGDVRPILLALLAGAGLLLLIACVNVASLLLVRSESRRRELAVRSALGASRGRLISQFVTEAIVLVVVGGSIGIVSALAAMRLLTKLIPEDLMDKMPFLQGLGLNPRVCLFAGAIALLAAAVFAVTPALRMNLHELRDGLVEGGRGSAGITWRRLGSKLVAVELAVAVVLLVGAGLLGQSLYRLLHVDLGFQPDHLATLHITAPPTGYTKNEQLVELGRTIISRVSHLPGVESAGLSSVLPVSFNGNSDWIRVVGHPYNGEHNEVNERQVSSEYFATIKANLVRGRYFTDAEDRSKARVAIISQGFAAKYFPDEDPIGIQVGDINLSQRSLREIVGVVDDIREGALDTDTWPTEYTPFNQNASGDVALVVRTSTSEKSILPALSDTIHQIDSGVVTSEPAAMSDRIADSQSAYLHRSAAWLVGGFAAIALLLSIVGLYGVIAYSVGQRTREIGVRIALGAERASVYSLVLKEAGLLAGIGIAVGLVCSVGAASLIRTILFGVQSWNAPTLISAAIVLGTAALLASYIPARRAASVNPVEALRFE